MSRRKGFTLIELLIVVAIIAVLVSILMPALRAARENATLAVCLGNLKVLANAYQWYANDNQDKIVGGDNHGKDEDWVRWPASVSIPDQKEAIERGALFPHVNNLDAYHCPGDKERISQTGAVLHAWGSYSITGCLNGEGYPGDCFGPENQIRKFSAITFPETKYVFVEEADWRGWNIRSCGVHMSFCGSGNTEHFGDRLAAFHAGKCDFGWLDGHASTRKWQYDRTLKFIDGEYGNSSVFAGEGNTDLFFLQEGFPYNR